MIYFHFSTSQRPFINFSDCRSPLKIVLACMSPMYWALCSDPFEHAQILVSEGKADGVNSLIPELPHMKTAQIVPSWMCTAPSPLCYLSRSQELMSGLWNSSIWQKTRVAAPFMAWGTQHPLQGNMNCQNKVANKTCFLTTRAVMTFNLLSGNLF